MLRDGLVQLLADRGFVVTDAVSDPDALRRAVDRDVPDVAVVDIRMPPTFTDEGLRAAIDLRRRPPRASGSCCSPSTSRPATRPSCWPTTPRASATC